MSMKAVRVSNFGDPSVLAVQEVPIPAPSASQVLVKVFSAGVNPVETYIRSGNHSIKPPLPWTPGNDGAGIVESVGEGVRNLAVGQRVYITGSTTGTYAQYAVSEADQVFPLPEKLSFQQGAAINIPYKTAYLAFSRAHAKPSQTVLIHGGSGAVGVAAIQFARSIGMKVIASAGTTEGLSLVTRLGAHLAVNHREEGYLNKVSEFTNNKGVNLIIEMAAHTNFVKDFDVLAPFGSIVVIGSRASLDFNARLIMAKNAKVIGVMAFGFENDAERDQCWASINAGLDNGTLAPVVGETFSLANAPAAHIDVIEHKSGSSGKITIQPWE